MSQQPITIAEVLAVMSSNRTWMKRFAQGPPEDDAVIDEVIGEITGNHPPTEDDLARFSEEKREQLKRATLAELQAVISGEWPGSVLFSHVC
jgi:hypothetical protein